MFDLVIRSGIVIDGSGRPAEVRDMGIVRDRIASISKTSVPHAVHELDTQGLLAPPGIVDIHTHYDGHAAWRSVAECSP